MPHATSPSRAGRPRPFAPRAAAPRGPRALAWAAAVALLLATAACAPSTSARPPALAPDRAGPVAVGPDDDPALPLGWRQEGEASWYGPGFAGRLTANGEIFDPSEMTAAHRTLPFDAHVRVTNLANGRSVLVRINDRGPFAHGRVIDLSRAAAEAIGLIASGVADVRIEPAAVREGPTPLRADARLSGYDVILPGVPAGSLVVLRAGDASVLARAVDLPPPSAPVGASAEMWTSAGLADRLGPVVTVVVD